MNSIQLIGRLTADPELRFTKGGTATCTIRLAVPRRRRKGEAEPAPVYVNVITYGAQAEAVASYMVKGRRVSDPRPAPLPDEDWAAIARPRRRRARRPELVSALTTNHCRVSPARTADGCVLVLGSRRRVGLRPAALPSTLLARSYAGKHSWSRH